MFRHRLQHVEKIIKANIQLKKVKDGFEDTSKIFSANDYSLAQQRNFDQDCLYSINYSNDHTATAERLRMVSSELGPEQNLRLEFSASHSGVEVVFADHADTFSNRINSI